MVSELSALSHLTTMSKHELKLVADMGHALREAASSAVPHQLERALSPDACELLQFQTPLSITPATATFGAFSSDRDISWLVERNQVSVFETSTAVLLGQWAFGEAKVSLPLR